VTIDYISHTQIDQISTDFQAFLGKRSLRSEQRKRRGVKPFRKARILPSDDRILDFAHGYYDADPVAEAFVKDAYIDGNSSHGRAMLDQALAHGIESVADAPAWKNMSRPPGPLETSWPGIFAAGDVRSGSVKRCAAAVGEGSMAVEGVHEVLRTYA